MEMDRKEGGEWKSVPAFGDWDMKNGVPDYSMDFTKIREMRKQNKNDLSRVSIGNEMELIPHKHDHRGDVGRDDDADDNHHGPVHHHQRDHAPTTKKKIMNYFNCCMIRA